MKRFLLILFVLSWSSSFAQVGELSVSAREESTGNIIPFSAIKIYRNNTLIQQGVTDSTGNYNMLNLATGMYEASCEEKSHLKATLKNILIVDGEISFAMFSLKKN